MKRFIYICSLLTIAIVSGCSQAKTESSDEEFWNAAINCDLFCSDIPFLASDVSKSFGAEEIQKVQQVNSLSFSLFKELSKIEESQSLAFSPLSMSYLLGMLSEGAANKTREEICSLFGFSSSDQTKINEFCRDLLVISADDKESSFDIANVVLSDINYKLLDPYCVAIRNYYDAAVASLPFTDKRKVAELVNKWANDHTRGTIDHVIDDVEGVMCLANAVYFSAPWAIAFNKANTTSGRFTPETGAPRSEIMMKGTFQDKRVSYVSNKLYTAVSLPLTESGKYTFTAVLPPANVALSSFISTLDLEFWENLERSLKIEPSVRVELPRIKTGIEVEQDLKEAIIRLGAPSMFFAPTADFSNMCDSELYVNKIKHIAVFELDEDGAKGSSVSYAEMRDSSPGIGGAAKFCADRPFIFAVKDNTSGALLFLGCYR